MAALNLAGKTSGYVKLKSPDVALNATVELPNKDGVLATLDDVGSGGGETATLESLGIPNHDQITVNALGNVGIGTDNPQGSFGVVRSGQGQICDFVNTNDAWAGDVNITYAPSGTTTSLLSLSARSDNAAWVSSNYGDLTFRTGTGGTATERMKIDANGHVLVGTDGSSGLANGSVENAGSMLENNGGILSQRNDGSNFYISKATGYTNPAFLSFYVNGQNIGRIKTNGDGSGCLLEGFATRASDVYFSDDEENPKQGKSLKETLEDRDKLIDKLVAKVEALEVQLKKVK